MTGDMQLGADPPPTSAGFRGRYLGSPGRGSRSSGESGGPAAARAGKQGGSHGSAQRPTFYCKSALCSHPDPRVRESCLPDPRGAGF